MKNKKMKIFAELFLLFLMIIPFVSSSLACVGENCPVNVALNVTNVTIIVQPVPRFSITGQAMYDVLNSAGAGIGSFFQVIGFTFPILLFIFVMIAIVVAVIYAIIYILRRNEQLTNK